MNEGYQQPRQLGPCKLLSLEKCPRACSAMDCCPTPAAVHQDLILLHAIVLGVTVLQQSLSNSAIGSDTVIL